MAARQVVADRPATGAPPGRPLASGTVTRAIALAVALACAMLAGAVPPHAAAKTRFVRSPSGNIGCVLHDTGARCDISKRDWRAPARPRACEFDWGSYVVVERGDRRGRFACVSDSAMDPRAPRLAYGRSIRVGGQRCTSRPSGMRCVNRRGHGFELARERYRLF